MAGRSVVDDNGSETVQPGPGGEGDGLVIAPLVQFPIADETEHPGVGMVDGEGERLTNRDR